jgi:hypothetical protein
MGPSLESRGNSEQRVRRPSEKQQQLSKSHPARLDGALAHLPSDEENNSQAQRRVTEAENRRRKEAGVVQPRPRSQNVRHEVRTPQCYTTSQTNNASLTGSIHPAS